MALISTFISTHRVFTMCNPSPIGDYFIPSIYSIFLWSFGSIWEPISKITKRHLVDRLLPHLFVSPPLLRRPEAPGDVVLVTATGAETEELEDLGEAEAAIVGRQSLMETNTPWTSEIMEENGGKSYKVIDFFGESGESGETVDPPWSSLTWSTRRFVSNIWVGIDAPSMVNS